VDLQFSDLFFLVSVTAASSCDSYGRDAFMKCEPVLSALDMGFDYETVRNVVHLRMVQSGRTCVLLICDGK